MRTDNKLKRKAQSSKRKLTLGQQTKQTKPAAVNTAYLDAIIAQHEQETGGNKRV